MRAAFVVEALGDGRFVTDGSVAGGRKVDMGPMALLRVGGVSVTVTSKRLQAYDKAPFRHLGIEPGEQRILALKSTCHYHAVRTAGAADPSSCSRRDTTWRTRRTIRSGDCATGCG